MPNRLAQETSPYLLQHAENPVDWFPWGEEAFTKAKAEDKPVFLSIGYSACHWCHVMERESFEDEELANFLNEHFVSIKVDREERPDVDNLYMNAAMAIMQGGGGWPLTVFLTPGQEIFFAGTYFPPRARAGQPGFDVVLQHVLKAYTTERENVKTQSAQVTSWLQDNHVTVARTFPTSEQLYESLVAMRNQFDSTNGGFGTAPKFPHCTNLSFLAGYSKHLSETGEINRDSTLQMAKTSLQKMSMGGIHDQIGGGFARYAVDEAWVVPHFEKMLYDNGALAGVYLDVYRESKDPLMLEVATRTLDYILDQMTDEQGGFYSAEDADSEGVEGKFYVWDRAEILEALGDEVGTRYCDLFNITQGGNFEGSNIVHLTKSVNEFADSNGHDAEKLRAEVKESAAKLFAIRANRVRPGLDDKVIVSWNALTISSMARASVMTGETKYAEAAAKAANFILENMRTENGRLLHTWCKGKARFNGYLDDYSHFAVALIDLYAADFNPEWIARASELTGMILDHFPDNKNGGFFFTSIDHEKLIARTKIFADNNVPSGNAMAAIALFRIGIMTGNQDWITQARKAVISGVDMILKMPMGCAKLLSAVEMILHPGNEIVLVGESLEQLKPALEAIRSKRFGNVAVVCKVADEKIDWNPMLEDKTMIDGEPTLYVCSNFACQSPVSGMPAIIDAINDSVHEKA